MPRRKGAVATLYLRLLASCLQCTSWIPVVVCGSIHRFDGEKKGCLFVHSFFFFFFAQQHNQLSGVRRVSPSSSPARGSGYAPLDTQ